VACRENPRKYRWLAQILKSCVCKKLCSQDKPFYLKRHHIVRKDILNPGDRGVCIIKDHIRFTTLDLQNYQHKSMELIGTVTEIDKNALLSTYIWAISTPIYWGCSNTDSTGNAL